MLHFFSLLHNTAGCIGIETGMQNAVISVQGKKGVLGNRHGYLKTCNLYDLSTNIQNIYLLAPKTTWTNIVFKGGATTPMTRNLQYAFFFWHSHATCVCQWQDVDYQHKWTKGHLIYIYIYICVCVYICIYIYVYIYIWETLYHYLIYSLSQWLMYIDIIWILKN